MEAGQLWLLSRSRQPAAGGSHSGAGLQPGQCQLRHLKGADGRCDRRRAGERRQHGQQGPLLVVLEAMKMEHPLKSGIDGVLKRLQVQVGDQVKNRQVLLKSNEAARRNRRIWLRSNLSACGYRETCDASLVGH